MGADKTGKCKKKATSAALCAVFHLLCTLLPHYVIAPPPFPFSQIFFSLQSTISLATPQTSLTQFGLHMILISPHGQAKCILLLFFSTHVSKKNKMNATKFFFSRSCDHSNNSTANWSALMNPASNVSKRTTEQNENASQVFVSHSSQLKCTKLRLLISQNNNEAPQLKKRKADESNEQKVTLPHTHALTHPHSLLLSATNHGSANYTFHSSLFCTLNY